MKNTLNMGQTVVSVLESAGLVVIALATVVAFGQEILVMIEARTVTLADLLLLFIYLEVLAMAAIYLKSGQLPVRLPLYIGMVALARYLVLDIKGMDEWKIMAVGATVLLLALAVLVIRFGHVRYPYGDEPEGLTRSPGRGRAAGKESA